METKNFFKPPLSVFAGNQTPASLYGSSGMQIPFMLMACMLVRNNPQHIIRNL